MLKYSTDYIIEYLENRGWRYRDENYNCTAYKNGYKLINFKNCMGVVDGFNVNKKFFKTIEEAIEYAKTDV